MSSPVPILDTTPQTQTPAPGTPDDSLGIDRAFVIQMARMPSGPPVGLCLVGLVSRVGRDLAERPQRNPLVVISFGMILAAFIDSWAESTQLDHPCPSY